MCSKLPKTETALRVLRVQSAWSNYFDSQVGKIAYSLAWRRTLFPACTYSCLLPLMILWDSPQLQISSDSHHVRVFILWKKDFVRRNPGILGKVKWKHKMEFSGVFLKLHFFSDFLSGPATDGLNSNKRVAYHVALLTKGPTFISAWALESTELNGRWGSFQSVHTRFFSRARIIVLHRTFTPRFRHAVTRSWWGALHRLITRQFIRAHKNPESRTRASINNITNSSATYRNAARNLQWEIKKVKWKNNIKKWSAWSWNAVSFE